MTRCVIGGNVKSAIERESREALGCPVWLIEGGTHSRALIGFNRKYGQGLSY